MPKYSHQQGYNVGLAHPADTADQAQKTVEKKVEMSQNRVRYHVGDALAFVEESPSGQLDHGHADAENDHDGQKDLRDLLDKGRKEEGELENNKDGQAEQEQEGVSDDEMRYQVARKVQRVRDDHGAYLRLFLAQVPVVESAVADEDGYLRLAAHVSRQRIGLVGVA